MNGDLATCQIMSLAIDLCVQYEDSLNAKKIKFELSKQKNYYPEFVAKILESKDQIQKGNVTRAKKENLKEFLGL